MTPNTTRADRTDVRRRGVQTVRRATIAVAVSAAAALAAISGTLAAGWAPVADATTSMGSTSAAGSGSATAPEESSGGDWGTSSAPQQSSGGSSHTTSGGS